MLSDKYISVHIVTPLCTAMASGTEFWTHRLTVLPLLILACSGLCLLILKKIRSKLEPIHVFLINVIGSFVLVIFLWVVDALFQIFGDSGHLCVEYIFLLFASLTCSFGIISMQIDRFLAIYWHMHYAERITTSKAEKSCCFSASLAALTAGGVFLFDKDYTRCIRPSFLIFTRGTNLFFDGIPRLIAVLATITVSIYTLTTHRRLSHNSVLCTVRAAKFP